MTHHFIVIEIKNALLLSSFIFQLLKNITKMDKKKVFCKTIPSGQVLLMDHI